MGRDSRLSTNGRVRTSLLASTALAGIACVLGMIVIALIISGANSVEIP